MRTLVVAALLALLAAGCGGVENEPNLALAAERTEASGSGRFAVTGTQGAGDERVSLACTGAAIYGSKRVRVRCESEGQGVFQAIAIGRDTYVRGAGTLVFATVDDKWVRSTYDPDDDSSLAGLSPQRLLTMLRNASSETERIGEEDVRGEETVRYRLTVNCKGAELDCDGTAPVDVWIADDGIVRRISVGDDSSTFTFEFFDFGADVAIEPPPADEVVDEDDLGSGSGGVTVQPGGPCTEGRARPITDEQARDALRRHGFHVTADSCGVLTNTGGNTNDVLAREGIVFCVVQRTPPPGAPKTVVRRGTEGADAELTLQNLECTILTDSPQGEEKIDRLEATFDELQRAIRP